MKKQIVRPLILFLLIVFSSVARSEPAAPFLTRNQSPLSVVYGIPAPTPAAPVSRGRWRTAWSLNAANMINIETTESEQLLIDGETVQFNLFAEYGLNDDWSLRLQLPYLRHSGGSLDGFIERYHDALGLEQGFRPGQPRHRLLYAYRRNNQTRLQLTEERRGPGDIQVMAARQLKQTADTDASLWLGAKLPTGEADRFTGSGAADLSAWGAARHTITDTWQIYGTAGAAVLGEGEILDELQEDIVAFGNAGAQWQPWSTVALKTQLEWHSAVYKETAMRFFSDVLQLTMGGTWRVSNNAFIDVAVAEDIKEDASPDVNFHLTFRIEH